jgi:hypothetical protein
VSSQLRRDPYTASDNSFPGCAHVQYTVAQNLDAYVGWIAVTIKIEEYWIEEYWAGLRCGRTTVCAVLLQMRYLPRTDFV